MVNIAAPVPPLEIDYVPNTTFEAFKESNEANELTSDNATIFSNLYISGYSFFKMY